MKNIFLLFLIIFVSLNYFAFADDKEKSIRIKNQEEFDRVELPADLTTLNIYIDSVPSSPINFQALSSNKDLRNLSIQPDHAIAWPIWDTFFSLPAFPNLEKLRFVTYSPYGNPSHPEGGLSKFWNFLALNYPHLRSLDISSLILAYPKDGEENTLQQLALLLPQIEELYLRQTFGSARERIEGVVYFKNLKVLDISNNTPYTKGKDLHFLYQLENLEVLNLNRSITTGAETDDFIASGSFPRLRSLDLANTVLSSLDFSQFAPDLKILTLNRSILYQTRFDHLATSQNLEKLNLQWLALKEEHIEQLNYLSIPSLKVLDLSGSPAKKIQFSHFAPNLTALNLSESNVTGGDVKEIGKLKDLQILHLDSTKISGASLKQLAHLSNLKILTLSKTQIRDGSFEELVNLSNLEELDLSETNLSLADFRKLFSLTQLKKLDISNLLNPNIDEAAIEELRQALSECQIIRKAPVTYKGGFLNK